MRGLAGSSIDLTACRSECWVYPKVYLNTTLEKCCHCCSILKIRLCASLERQTVGTGYGRKGRQLYARERHIHE